MSCHQGPEIKNLSEVLVTYSLGVFISRYHPDSHSHLSQKAKGTMVTLQCCPSQVLVMFAYLLISGRRIHCKWQSESQGAFPEKASTRIPKCLSTVCTLLCYSKSNPCGQPVVWPLLCQGGGGEPDPRNPWVRRSVGLVQERLRKQFPFVLLSAM